MMHCVLQYSQMNRKGGVKKHLNSLFYGSNETEKNTNTIKYINHKMYEVIWKAEGSKVFALLIDKLHKKQWA